MQDQKVEAPPSLCVPMMISTQLSRKLQNTKAQGELWWKKAHVVSHLTASQLNMSQQVHYIRELLIQQLFGFQPCQQRGSISPAIGWIVMEVYKDIHDPQRITPTIFGDCTLFLQFHKVNICVFREKYLNNFQMHCH